MGQVIDLGNPGGSSALRASFAGQDQANKNRASARQDEALAFRMEAEGKESARRDQQVRIDQGMLNLRERELEQGIAEFSAQRDTAIAEKEAARKAQRELLTQSQRQLSRNPDQAAGMDIVPEMYPHFLQKDAARVQGLANDPNIRPDDIALLKEGLDERTREWLQGEKANYAKNKIDEIASTLVGVNEKTDRGVAQVASQIQDRIDAGSMTPEQGLREMEELAQRQRIKQSSRIEKAESLTALGTALLPTLPGPVRVDFRAAMARALDEEDWGHLQAQSYALGVAQEGLNRLEKAYADDGIDDQEQATLDRGQAGLEQASKRMLQGPAPGPGGGGGGGGDGTDGTGGGGGVTWDLDEKGVPKDPAAQKVVARAIPIIEDTEALELMFAEEGVDPDTIPKEVWDQMIHTRQMTDRFGPGYQDRAPGMSGAPEDPAPFEFEGSPEDEKRFNEGPR